LEILELTFKQDGLSNHYYHVKQKKKRLNKAPLSIRQDLLIPPNYSKQKARLHKAQC
jgi:hypothetical protein